KPALKTKKQAPEGSFCLSLSQPEQHIYFMKFNSQETVFPKDGTGGSCRYTRARTHPAWPLAGGLVRRLHRRTRERDHVDGPVRVPTSIPGPVVLVHRHGRAHTFDVPGVRWRFPDVIRITHIHGS